MIILLYFHFQKLTNQIYHKIIKNKENSLNNIIMIKENILII